jgi:glutathione synthase/RimK-type ligase-like ATP-grasp enzyme
MPIILPHILMVQRDESFSPNAVEKDLAILQAVGEKLRERGASVSYVKEELLQDKRWKLGDRVGVIFSMARSEKSLAVLQQAQAEGVMVVNDPRSIEICNSRRAIDGLMRSNRIPAAPYYERGKGWIKADRGHDVRFAANEEEMLAFKQQVEDPLLTAHVEGTLVKFYGVADRFFSPQGYPQVAEAAARLARLVGIQVYGGDAVLLSDGTFAIIDFNDWPSFSSCREEAAAAICRLI